ncbi:hypothetical protein Hte_006226 [Hypoxylon texense]
MPPQQMRQNGTEAVEMSKPSSTLGNSNEATEPVACSNLGHNAPGSIPTLEGKGAAKPTGFSLKAAARFAYTKNWCHHDPIPFDSPITTLKLSDYKRREGALDQTPAPESHFSLKRLREKTQSIDQDADLSGPGSLSKTPGVKSFLEATSQGMTATPAVDSQLAQSILDQVSFNLASSTKAREAETPKTESVESDEDTESTVSSSESSDESSDDSGEESDGKSGEESDDDEGSESSSDEDGNIPGGEESDYFSEDEEGGYLVGEVDEEEEILLISNGYPASGVRKEQPSSDDDSDDDSDNSDDDSDDDSDDERDVGR